VSKTTPLTHFGSRRTDFAVMHNAVTAGRLSSWFWVTHETTVIHQTSRWRGDSLAACGARTAGTAHAANRRVAADEAGPDYHQPVPPRAGSVVASLGRPGGNITGLTFVHDHLAGKSVELLKDTVPWVSRVAALFNPDHADPEFRATQTASQTLGVQLQPLEVRQPGDFDAAFQAAERQRAEAIIVLWGRFMSFHRQQIGDFAAKNRLIMVGAPSFVTEIGGLLSYGPDVPELLRLASS